jgi:preprotein translocase subunit SecB
MRKKMSYKIIAKYIKTLNFSISKPDKFFSLTKDIANYKFKIDIKSNPYKDNIIEVQTSLSLEPKDNNLDTINAVVTYSTLVQLEKDLTDKQKLEKIILIEIPNEIYPELRKVFIFIFENSGFREIKIDESIDFKKLYLSRKN